MDAFHTAAADAEHRHSPAGAPSYAARGGESVPRNYSTIQEWDAYYAGRAPKPEHPPF